MDVKYNVDGQRKEDDLGGNVGPRILIVDDDETILDVITVLLEEAGYQVVTAMSAEKGFKLFEADPFPVVFTDLRMKGMDGMELLKKIRKINEDSQVVMMTAHASLDSSIESLREGAYDYLVKPLSDHSIVVPLVERALEKVRLVVENNYLFERLQKSYDELSNTNNMLREITLKDGLTGLYNKRYFNEIIDNELRRSRRHNRAFSILFCDIDNFKDFNDANGHLLGDQALKDFSKLIGHRLRVTDFSSRYGGEEFVLLLPETDIKDATVVANEICKMIFESKFEGEESQKGGRLTVSIGVSAFPQHGDNEDDLLHSADKALYQAKSDGRNRVNVAK